MTCCIIPYDIYVSKSPFCRNPLKKDSTPFDKYSKSILIITNYLYLVFNFKINSKSLIKSSEKCPIPGT